MAIKKHHLSLDDTFEETFHLLAIYSNLEAYRMAFVLNKTLDLNLIKTVSIHRKKEGAEFDVYEFSDPDYYRSWLLLHNYAFVQTKQSTVDLFSQDAIFEQKLVYHKELKKAPFLLKIIADINSAFLQNTVHKLQKHPLIYTVDLIDITQLKNQKLLIF